MEKENHGNDTWLGGYSNSIDPVSGTGIQNVRYSTSGDVYIYDGTPVPPIPIVTSKLKFPWVLYARKFRNKYK